MSTYLCGAFENTNTDKMFTVSSLQALIRTCLPFSQTGQMIELCCEYLSVRCFLKIQTRIKLRFTVCSLHALIRTRF